MGDVLLEGDDEVAEFCCVRRDVADDKLLLCEVEPKACIIHIEWGQLKANSPDGILVIRHGQIKSLLKIH